MVDSPVQTVNISETTILSEPTTLGFNEGLVFAANLIATAALVSVLTVAAVQVNLSAAPTAYSTLGATGTYIPPLVNLSSALVDRSTLTSTLTAVPNSPLIASLSDTASLAGTLTSIPAINLSSSLSDTSSLTGSFTIEFFPTITIPLSGAHISILPVTFQGTGRPGATITLYYDQSYKVALYATSALSSTLSQVVSSQMQASLVASSNLQLIVDAQLSAALVSQASASGQLQGQVALNANLVSVSTASLIGSCYLISSLSASSSLYGVIHAAGLDAATSAWVVAATANGYTPSIAKQQAMDTFIKSIKSAFGISVLNSVSNGVFDRMWMLANEDPRSAYVDLITNEVLTTSNTPPTFIANNGVQAFGNSTYLITPTYRYATGPNYTLNNAHICGYCIADGGAYNAEAVGILSSYDPSWYPRTAAGNFAFGINQMYGGNWPVPGGRAVGTHIGSRLSSSALHGYFNGVEQMPVNGGGDNPRTLQVANNLLTIGAGRNTYFAGVVAFVSVGAGIADQAHAAALHNAITAYLYPFLQLVEDGTIITDENGDPIMNA